METKHTPGPWSYWSGYNPYDKVEAQVTAEGGDIVIASYNHLIAEGEANAKLMAAAPELLAALEALYREFEETMLAEYVTWEPDATGYPAALEAKRLIELTKQ